MHRFPADLLRPSTHATGQWVLWLLLGLCGAGLASASPRVRIGVENNSPPLSFLDADRQPAGFTTELLREVARAGDIDIEIVPNYWTAIQSEFRAGRIDVLANVVISDERRQEMDFSIAQAYIHGVVYTRPGSPPVRKTADLAGKTIGTLRATIAHTYAVKHPEWGATIKLFGSWQELLEAVKQGECDAALFLRPLTHEMPKDYGLHSEFVEDILYQFHFAVHKGDSATLERLNEGLATVRHNGTFDRLYNKWLGPIEPHPIRLADLQPYSLPIALGALALATLFWWQRHMLARFSRQAEALRENEARWKFAIEGAGDGVWDWDCVTRRIVRSRRLEEMLGFAEDEIGTGIGEWERRIHPEDLPEQQAALREHLAGQTASYRSEHRVQTKDGTWKWILARGLVIGRNAQRQPLRMIGTHTDITERKQADQKLRISEERFRSFLQRVNSVAVQSYGPDGIIQYWNGASKQLYGYTAEEASGRNVQDLIIPAELREWFGREMRQIVESGQPGPAIELALQRKDGSRIAVFSSQVIVQIPGRPPELFCIDIDLTPLRQAEGRLRLLSGALEAAANAIVITDRQGVIIWSNAAFTAFTGYSTAEANGQNLGKLLKSNRHDAAFYQNMWNTILAGKTWQGEVINRRKDGSLYTEEMTITPMKEESGAITHFIAVKQDISQRKNLEIQFRQAQKMEAIGQLAGGVAHDFNNILAAVLMYLGLIQEEPSLDQHTRTSLKELEKEVQRGAVLTRQLLAFSRQQAMEFQPVELSAVLAGLLKMLRRLLGEQIVITLAEEANLPWIQADAGMLEQVVINLCVNARDAMPRGGPLSLRTEAVELTAAMATGTVGARAGSFLRLSVTDAGSGMDERTLQRIFEPFFTTKPIGHGTGLGLATVYGIVQQHHGWIEVESTVGSGTTFKVYLPTCERPAEPSRETEALRPAVGRGETILVAEDEPSVRTVVVKTLKLNGYHVIDAANGPEAVQQWQIHHGKIDLLLTDMVMPQGMNGLELAEKLRESRPDLKVLICTGYSQALAAEQTDPTKQIAVLRKPFSSTKLLNAVRESLDQTLPDRPGRA